GVRLGAPDGVNSTPRRHRWVALGEDRVGWGQPGPRPHRSGRQRMASPRQRTRGLPPLSDRRRPVALAPARRARCEPSAVARTAYLPGPEPTPWQAPAKPNLLLTIRAAAPRDNGKERDLARSKVPWCVVPLEVGAPAGGIGVALGANA